MKKNIQQEKKKKNNDTGNIKKNANKFFLNV